MAKRTTRRGFLGAGAGAAAGLIGAQVASTASSGADVVDESPVRDATRMSTGEVDSLVDARSLVLVRHDGVKVSLSLADEARVTRDNVTSSRLDVLEVGDR